MNLITRCPACRTMFKVVPDQLRISEGWVRCGQCDEVFDANSNMQDETAFVKLEKQPAEKPSGLAEFSPEVTPGHVPFWNVQKQDLEPVLESTVTAEPENPPPVVEPVVEKVQKDPVPGKKNTGIRSTSPKKQKPFPKRKAINYARVLGIFSATVLTLLLVFQVMLKERNRIATYAPALAPVLQMACEHIACSISPLQQIESVVIDSSSFTKLRADAYRLNFVIKNTAQVALAIPSVELTLSDVQGQTVMRKVLSPQDFSRSVERLDANGEIAASISLSVKTEEGKERFNGYQLLAFYP